LGSSGIEAVGDGTVTATLNGELPEGCSLNVIINGEKTTQVNVKDGDSIEVMIETSGNCECCETQRECSSNSSGLFLQKSNKDRKTIILDKEIIMSKVKLAVEKVRKRKK
jgi:hypothetical protein